MPRNIGAQPDNRMVLFTNFSDQPFTWFWDSIPQTFEAGGSEFMEMWRARHFAKHLINREMQRQDVKYTPEERKFKTHLILDEDSLLRVELVKRCISQVPESDGNSTNKASQIYEANLNHLSNSTPEEIIASVSNSPEQVNVGTAVNTAPEKRKPGRPAKPKVTTAPTAEDSFEGK